MVVFTFARKQLVSTAFRFIQQPTSSRSTALVRCSKSSSSSTASFFSSVAYSSPSLLEEKGIIMDIAVPDIEDLHQAALERGENTYIDPATGFTVFTELAHLKRGRCCGNHCRHCPYGFENVREPNVATRRAPKLQSGDKTTAKAMVDAILFNAQNNDDESNGTPFLAAKSASSSKKSTTTNKNVPYTRGGDKGTSQLGTGERRSKDDNTFEALGTVDELCSVVGVVHAQLNPDKYDAYQELPTWLLDVMSRLFDIGSHIAKPNPDGTFVPNGIGGGVDEAHIQELEVWINQMTEELPELTSFILPTGAPAAAQLHVARTVCRRAERRVVPLVVDDHSCDPNAMKYLNRLSDFFFVAARWVNFCEGQAEIQYQRNKIPSSSNDDSDNDNDTTNKHRNTQRERVARSLRPDN